MNARLLISSVAFAVFLACSQDQPPPLPRAMAPALAPKAAAVDLHGLVPAAGGPFAPSQLEIGTGGAPSDGATLTETESCAGCHADTAAQWRQSAHAFASFNNPVYRVTVDRFRAEIDHAPATPNASRFCAGCHDVALLVDGAMAKDVLSTDSRAHGGITCRVCHGIEQARPDGNASFTLSSAPIVVPVTGDAESVRRHKQSVALAPLRTSQMCGSCHRSFLDDATGNPSHLIGMDDLTAWSESPYAGSLSARIDEAIPERDCQSCHMPREDAPNNDAAAKEGKVASHRFSGGHTWLAAMRGDADAERRAAEMLRGAASIDIAAVTHDASSERTLPADGANVRAGESMTFDVVVRNERVGHRFPGGTLDAQDVWIEIDVRDAYGALLAEAGEHQEAQGDDLTAHRLRAVQADDQGQPLLLRETNRFRATVFNHTIAPRDAELVRFRFDVPANLARASLPLRVSARLRHRSRNLALARVTCDDAKTKRGAAFAAEVRARTGEPFDPCAKEPVTEIAASTIFVGDGSSAMANESARTEPLWRRMYNHALASSHSVEERLDDARPSLLRALTEVSPTSREHAMIAVLFAQVAAREGRLDEVSKWLDEASAIAPGHPAIARARGASLATAWRWQEAVGPLRAWAALSTSDDRAWAELTVAYGSSGNSALALSSAKAGLALQPRDETMLRVQALSLEALGAPREEVDDARRAYLDYRAPDDAPRIRNACAKNVPGCALERLPVHVHVMRAAP